MLRIPRFYVVCMGVLFLALSLFAFTYTEEFFFRPFILLATPLAVVGLIFLVIGVAQFLDDAPFSRNLVAFVAALMLFGLGFGVFAFVNSTPYNFGPGPSSVPPDKLAIQQVDVAQNAVLVRNQGVADITLVSFVARDVNGTAVCSGSIDGIVVSVSSTETVSLDLSGLPAGVYSLVLISASGGCFASPRFEVP